MYNIYNIYIIYIITDSLKFRVEKCHLLRNLDTLNLLVTLLLTRFSLLKVDQNQIIFPMVPFFSCSEVKAATAIFVFNYDPLAIRKKCSSSFKIL